MGHIYSAPYALLETSLAFVAEDADGVAGFAVGARETLAWEDRLERDWWPTLRKRYSDPPHDDASGWTADQRRAHTIHHPTQTPPEIATAYPAHVHLNLLPRLQSRGLGRRLFAEWHQAAGLGAVHVGVNRANTRAIGFWQKLGFAEIGANERTVWLGRI